MANIQVESRRMLDRFRRLDAGGQRYVKEAVASTTQSVFSDVRALASVAVVGNARSRPGQPPRRDTGRLVRSIIWKLSPKGWVGYVTTTKESQDSKGRRYPWMLESGTKHVKKRPLFKRAQKAAKRKHQQAVGRAMMRAVQGAR